ncbi:hypothetical protein AAVH_34342 [Aphelenchoides avenae]|nr:hypothetical protein AAVH_34342 [Aphelenchus avenae]
MFLTHKADLVLDARFEPSTYPAGCDKDAYRRYFKRGKVYVVGSPLGNRIGNVPETIRGLRPDAVVLMPLQPSDAEVLDRMTDEVECRMVAERAFPQEVIVAYEEAKALRNCTIVCDGKTQMAPSQDVEKRANVVKKKFAGGLSGSEKWKTVLETGMLMSELKRSIEVERKVQPLYMAFVLQRTLNERASEKYQRLRASKKDELEPVRIVSVVDSAHLVGIDANWQSPIDQQRVMELLKEDRSPGSRAAKIVAGIALLYIIFTLTHLEELTTETALETLRRTTEREGQ